MSRLHACSVSMILANLSVERVVGLDTICWVMFSWTSIGLVAGVRSGRGTLKVGVAVGAVMTVVGVETTWVGTSTVGWLGRGGGGGGDAGGRYVFVKSSVGGWKAGKITQVPTMTKRIRWRRTAPKK